MSVHVSCNISDLTSKYGKMDKNKTCGAVECIIDVLIPFDIFCDLLLYRPTVMWNLIVFYDKKAKIVDGEIVYESVFQ